MRQLYPLNGNDVIKVDMYYVPPIPIEYIYQVSLDRLNGSWEIIIFMFCVRKWPRDLGH